ncbi:MAG: hypothetical protein WAV40_01890 [Microgenomates group bacterium]
MAGEKDKIRDCNWETMAAPRAMIAGIELYTKFMHEFATGILGDDKEKAMALFLHQRGLNNSPDVIEE